MDEAYTGSTIGDGGGDSGSEESCTNDVADPERHWASPGVAAVLQAATNSPQSDRLKQILNITPRLLHMYFTVALRDANNTLICALIPILMARNSTLFPDKNYMYEVGRRLLEFMLASFQRSPDFIALLKTELALQLCWAVGEHGGGVGRTKMRLGNFLKESVNSDSRNFRKSSQSRLLCFVITAIAKLAAYYH
ncbi:hypothetical protein CXB51_000662 [Gossypium anomalum]|uniref:AP-5 complex subunit zeta-1 C-terminal TPR domain-containing protein n=1 Tax=Gossypium anomalum TaxID=47600 RepID=A0A8J5ZJ46_9ROSI|nr:hypothetical protein CXB51_000662 [Gossypium anomalum]